MRVMVMTGCLDATGALLKLGRVRVTLDPNPFSDTGFFRQELKLNEGHVEIQAGAGKTPQATLRIWVEVHRPVAHVEIDSQQPVSAHPTYETWRYEDIDLPCDRSKFGRRAMCSMDYDQYPGRVKVHHDIIEPGKNGVVFYHHNRPETVFDYQIHLQKLEAVRDRMHDRLGQLAFGGLLTGENLTFDGAVDGEYASTPFRGWRFKSKTSSHRHRIKIFTHIEQTPDIELWKEGLYRLASDHQPGAQGAWHENLKWWEKFWQRSWIVINPDKAGTDDAGWQVARNYNIFRYMLASNRSGMGATPFNGGLFTFDPIHTSQETHGRDISRPGTEPGYTPDHRQWGAGLTAQNQRLLYWPMLKNGDFDMMPPGFLFYYSGFPNAAGRVRHYWGHEGCAFPEQPSVTALPGAAMYGHREGGGRARPENLPADIERSPAAGNLFDSQLDWSWMVLEYHRFSGEDISIYLPFIEQSVIFYDEHYRLRRKQLAGEELDENGKLAIYPANTLEHHPHARNPALSIAGLHQILTRLMELPERYCTPERKERWSRILLRIPRLPIEEDGEHRIVKPAENYGHRSWHMPQMYPLWPFETHGQGLPELQVMRDTFLHGVSTEHREDTRAWTQGFIHYARMGMAKKAQAKAIGKLSNGPYRFPAFWPESIDYVPDFNWGGSGMVGLQEMLMQTHLPAPASLHGRMQQNRLRVDDENSGKIRLLPAWPENWDVNFKLHAPQNTAVEGRVRNGKVTELTVTPEKRRNDVILPEEK